MRLQPVGIMILAFVSLGTMDAPQGARVGVSEPIRVQLDMDDGAREVPELRREDVFLDFRDLSDKFEIPPVIDTNEHPDLRFRLSVRATAPTDLFEWSIDLGGGDSGGRDRKGIVHWARMRELHRGGEGFARMIRFKLGQYGCRVVCR